MSTPQVGDTITTVRELVTLPPDSVVVDASGIPRTRRRKDSHMDAGWTHAGRSPLSNVELADGRPMTVVYVPGQLPRSERAVKAEALREAADALTREGVFLLLRALLYERAAHVERGEL